MIIFFRGVHHPRHLVPKEALSLSDAWEPEAPICPSPSFWLAGPADGEEMCVGCVRCSWCCESGRRPTHWLPATSQHQGSTTPLSARPIPYLQLRTTVDWPPLYETDQKMNPQSNLSVNDLSERLLPTGFKAGCTANALQPMGKGSFGGWWAQLTGVRDSSWVCHSNELCHDGKVCQVLSLLLFPFVLNAIIYLLFFTSNKAFYSNGNHLYCSSLLIKCRTFPLPLHVLINVLIIFDWSVCENQRS